VEDKIRQRYLAGHVLDILRRGSCMASLLILINDLPVIIANIFTFVQAFIILILKLKYK
jgi:uncharacterized protein with PQ loop repeat